MANRIFVEPVLDAVTLRDMVTDEEWLTAAGFGFERRRNEYLTWRALVRRELGRDTVIEYDAAGAPTVDIPDIYISVSHARDAVAVVMSDRRCGVDIECSDRNFSIVADRYMSPRERAMSADPLWPAVAWCAKETMYKYYGRRGASLARDLILDSYDSVGKMIETHMIGEESCPIYIKKIKNYILASTVMIPKNSIFVGQL